jgi:REP element-mobilizing transposase RayT
MCIEGRKTGWLVESLHVRFREVLLHAEARYQFLCPVYCLMPDHLHLLWLGWSSSCDQALGSRFFRKHFESALSPFRLQKQPHDHVLRESERARGAFEKTAHYILENPVRKNLAAPWHEYRFSGCMVQGYPELDIRAPDYWTRFWRVYAYLREHAV